MKRKIISLLVILSVFIVIVFSAGFAKNSVRISDCADRVIAEYSFGADITLPLKKAFEYTKNNASENNRLTITLSKGVYSVEETLYLTSYTTLDLGKSRLINRNKERGNIFKSPNDKAYYGYSSLKSFTLKNGTLDGNYNKNRSCILRLCHSEDITIQGVEFLNNYFSHHAEVAASKNVVFRECVFFGQVSNLNISSSEAVQIDILDPIHFYGFTSYDNTMNRSIYIEGCHFKNVFRGVGTHNYFKDLYQTDIRVVGCVFENITDCAISCVNYDDVLFENNEYINCKYSVFFYDNNK